MSARPKNHKPTAPARATAPDRSLPPGGKIAYGIAAVGAIGLLIGLFNLKQLGYSYLLAYMFFLSLCLGSLFLVMLHHLFDASWSTPIRRLLEHMAFLLPWMALLFIPVALLAPRIYPWMQMADPDHALHAKSAFLNVPFFYLRAVFYFAIWSLLAWQLRSWSLKQDKTGAALCTYRLRTWSAVGIILFAFTVTLAAMDWMKSLQHQWFSTMYGVYYFAGSVWLTIPTVYMLTLILQRRGALDGLVTPTLYYYLGSMFLAFTVFYAYIHFSQYFIIWNGNLPEEMFWYAHRETGTWWDIGMVLVFGHFLVPFLLLLRIDLKLSLVVIGPLCIWAWLMHYADLSYNIMPVLHPEGFVLHWLDLASGMLIGGVLAALLLGYMARHPAFPLRDPRLKEAVISEEIPAPETVVVPRGHS